MGGERRGEKEEVEVRGRRRERRGINATILSMITGDDK